MSEEHHYQHDPDQTELEKWINAGLNKAEPYSNQILIGFIAATVMAVVAIFWLRSTGEAASAGWTEFVSNNAPDDYKEVAEENPNAVVAVWAELQAGRLYLNEGLNTALTNRETSDEQLNKAKEAFNGVLDNKQAPASAREGALHGLASALEALSDADTEPAIKAYQALLDEFPDSIHAPWAEARIAELKTGEAQNFYAWFRKQNPAPTDRPKPRDVSTPASDSLLDSLQLTPEGDDTPSKPKDGPQAPDLPENAEKKPADDSKPAEMKADAKPAEDKPAEEPKPAPEAPSEPEKPAEEKPEVEKTEEPAPPKAEEKVEAEEKPTVEAEPTAEGQPAATKE